MKNYLKFLPVVLFILSGCSDKMDEVDTVIDNGHKSYISLSEQEYNSIAYPDKKDLSDEEVESIAKSYIGSIKGSNTRSALNSLSNVQKEKISLSLTTKQHEKGEEIYFTKLKWIDHQAKKPISMIVSSDCRFPYVIAFSEEGDFFSPNETADLMIKNAMNIALQEIAVIKQCEDSLREKTKAYVNMQIRKKGMKHVEYLVNNTPVTHSSATDNPSGQLYKIVEPMLKTKWNQTSPYNLYVPKCPPEYDFDYGYDGRHPAGCTIIAWAQVLAYLQPNINDITTPEGQKFYWGNLGSYSPNFWGYHELTEEDKRLASLIKNLADGSGTKFTSEGGSVSVDAVANYVKKWNVHIDGKNSCTFQNMANSLNSRRPVICRGTARAIRGTRATGAFTNGSHAWVVDGYQIRVRPSNVAPSPKQPRRILKRYNVYCHANMGWGGSFDGWYLYRYDGSIDFDCGGDLYDINLACYPNARLN